MGFDVHVRLDEELEQRLEAYSQRAGCSTSEAVRTAVERLLAEQRSPESDRSFADRLRESGLIGSIQEGPGDLSTNPKYMEGFGE